MPHKLSASNRKQATIRYIALILLSFLRAACVDDIQDIKNIDPTYRRRIDV